MYKLIENHPTVREQYAAVLAELDLVAPDEAERLVEDEQARLRAVHEELKASFGAARPGARSAGSAAAPTRRSTPQCPPRRCGS